MKKIFACLLISFFTFACNDEKKPTARDQQGVPINHRKDTIPRAEALTRLRKVKTGKLNDTTWVEFNRDTLKAILNDTSIQTIKFFITRRDNDDTPGSKKYLSILLQAKTTNKSNEFLYYQPSKVCPPPDNCAIEE